MLNIDLSESQMGYPQRFFKHGYVWHLTGRCHNRQFLLDKILYRKIFVDALYQIQIRYRVPVLNYTVTSNHFHLLIVCPQNETAIPKMMRDIASKVAAAHNKKTRRKGGFWERRYHATAVETGEHLVRCSLYIDTNMVRAGAVKHPTDWRHSGVNEIINPKERYKLIDIPEFSRLAGMPEDPEFPQHYAAWLENVLRKGCLSRDEVWTAELAVGSKSFVEHIRQHCGYATPVSHDHPSIREEPATYGPDTYQPSNLLEWEYIPNI